MIPRDDGVRRLDVGQREIAPGGRAARLRRGLDGHQPDQGDEQREVNVPGRIAAKAGFAADLAFDLDVDSRPKV